MIGLGPLLIGILGAVTNRGLLSFWTGLALAGAIVTFEYSISLRFEGRHLDETRDFWRDHEARMRPRAFAALSLQGASRAPSASVTTRSRRSCCRSRSCRDPSCCSCGERSLSPTGCSGPSGQLAAPIG